MSRGWWLRAGAPSDEEIRREICAHVERLEAEEIAGGAPPEEAAARARDRFGDASVIAAEMRAAWSVAPPGAARIGLLMGLATGAAFVVLTLNAALARGGGMTMLLFSLPAMLVAAMPLGAAVGAAIAAAGSRFDPRAPAIHRTTAGQILGLSAVATLLCFAVYLAVPASNARHVELRRQRPGAPSQPPLNVRCAGIPLLVALADASSRSPRIHDAVAALPPRAREATAVAARFELQQRAALPAACLVLALAGMACGAVLRRLRFAPALAVLGAAAASVLWFVIHRAAAARVLAHPSSAGILAWLPDVAMLALAVAVLAALAAIGRARPRPVRAE